jgi:SnoaL-like domain
MSNSLTGEAADRLAIRNLVDAWAHCADRRKPDQQAALFTPDGTVIVYMGDPATSEPVQLLKGHAELAEAFTVLDGYDATTHFTGQSTVTLDADRATGETYCLAHHLWAEDGQRTLMVMSIRYLDTFARHDGTWLFAERQLITDWIDKRPSSAQ